MSNTKHTPEQIIDDGFNFDIHFYSESGRRDLIQYVKNYAAQQNSSLLEALKEVAELWEEGLPLDLTTYNKVKNAIKQAEQ